MKKIKKCPKCGGKMEEGKTMATSVGGSIVWIKKDKKTKLGAPQIKSLSYIDCGYIESYTDRT